MKKLLSFFVFLIFFVSINQNTAFAQEPQNYLGSIDKNSVEMTLTFGDMNDKGMMNITGRYFYTNNQVGSLTITGKLDYNSGKVAMTEKNSQGKTTGFFNGTYNPNGANGVEMKGIWTSVDKKRNLKFSLLQSQ